MKKNKIAFHGSVTMRRAATIPGAFVSFFVLLLSTVLSSQEVSQSLNSNWQFTESGKNEWLPATVPGTVHTDLLANKKIPDPYIGTNESKVQWVETKTWEYKTGFDASEEIWKSKHKELVFEGLDTYAFVYLNDSLILTGENMFVGYRIDIGKFLKKKGNVLRIAFHPASELIEKNKAASTIKNLPGGDRVFIRKAQYQFGWDWGPRLVTCGIWKKVRLEAWDAVTILDAKYRTITIDNDTATIDVEINTLIDSEKTFDISLSSGNTVYYQSKFTAKTKSSLIYFQIKIPHPKLWWCNGYGKANLYDFKFSMNYGNVHADLITRTGIRIIKFNEKIDGEYPNDSGFAFNLNGQPVFAKGSNWIPNDNFLPRVTSQTYYSLIKNAQTSNMNMLRVWGGGVYEDEHFYNDCDSLGIMVWQDFMFAGGMYPASTSQILDAYKNEISQQTTRLLNHPCISVWCGNNEIEEGWNNWGWQKEYKINAKDSAEMIRSYDGLFSSFRSVQVLSFSNIPYIFSSPSTGWGHPEAYKSGDVHYWGVWWGNEPFSAYDSHVGRFMSEYGFQALPPLSSFRLFDEDGNISFGDPTFLAHQKHPKGYETIGNYMQRDYPVPDEFSDYVYVSQVMQRDGISRAIKDHRRAMPYCMGTLFWQYNDCWPVTSWSTVDYYGQKKLLQYALKDLYAPIMISVMDRNDSVLIYVVNDDTIRHEGILGFQWMSFEGMTARTSIQKATLYAGTSTMVLAFPKNMLTDNLSADKGVLNLVFSYEGDKFVNEKHYFNNTKSLALPKDPGIATDISPVKNANGSYTISLRTVSLAKNVYLTIEDAPSNFSDNGFDLIAGETKDVTVSTSLSLEELKKRLKIQVMNTL